MPKTITGINDLASQNPALAEEWHPTKNGDLRPENVAYASKKKVWWLGKCGHEWEAIVGSRKIGRGCPICAGMKILPGYNDLESNSAELTKEWDYEKNVKKPSEVGCGTHEYAWWKCSTCGHSWKAEIRGRYNGNGCPECTKKVMSQKMHEIKLNKSGSLLESGDSILEEWNYEKNTDVSPQEVTAKASKKVWWKCSLCEYEWMATISNRARGSGCPACSGAVVHEGNNDFRTCHPELLSEWDYDNNDIMPEKFHASSGKKIHWKCRFGHRWEASIHDRVTKGVGCPFCSKHYKTSFGEQSIFYYVKKFFPEAVNTYKASFLGRSEIDIYIPSVNIGIEYDGQRYHKNKDKDEWKDKLCLDRNMVLIRVREPKCIRYERTNPTFYLNKLDNEDLTYTIIKIMEILGIQDANIDVERDFSEITAIYHNVALKDSIYDKYPDLAKQWAEENRPLIPQNIPATKGKTKYYWKCEKCNWIWQALLAERINGTGCPVCANKVVVTGKNDFCTTHPELALEWNYEKNEHINPKQITYGCTEGVWWRCSICGCEWHTRVNRRVNGSGCPDCAKERRKKKVCQFDLNGNLLNTYESVTEAAKSTGISTSAISYGCKGKKGSHIRNGYAWNYYEEE